MKDRKYIEKLLKELELYGLIQRDKRNEDSRCGEHERIYLMNPFRVTKMKKKTVGMAGR